MDSDPEVVLIDKLDEDELSTDKDSGMESAGNSKDDTPERKSATIEELPREEEVPKTAEPAAPQPQPQPAAAPAAPAPAPAPRPTAPTASSAAPSSAQAIKSKEDDFDDEPDESLSERLWGLTEMFPDSVRNLTGAVVNLSAASVKTVYQFTCSASWIFFTSSMILFAPVVFEMERAQMEELQRSQQKQVLLGPGSAVGAGGGGGPGGMPALPPMAAR